MAKTSGRNSFHSNMYLHCTIVVTQSYYFMLALAGAHQGKPQDKWDTPSRRPLTRFSINMLSPRKRASFSAFRTYATVPASTSSSRVQRTPSQGSRYSYRVQLQPSEELLTGDAELLAGDAELLVSSERPGVVVFRDSVEEFGGAVSISGSAGGGSRSGEDDVSAVVGAAADGGGVSEDTASAGATACRLLSPGGAAVPAEVRVPAPPTTGS